MVGLPVYSLCSSRIICRGDSRESRLGTPFPSGKMLKEGFRKEVFWGQCFFNIFINDLFYSVTQGKLHAYADDHQLYSSGVEPVALENCICQFIVK